MIAGDRRTLDARLAALETHLECLRADLSAVRQYIPERMIEYGDRIAFLERQNRFILWLGGALFAAALSVCSRLLTP